MSAGGRTGKRGGRRWRLLGRHELPGPEAGSDSSTAGVEPGAADHTPIRDCYREGPEGRQVVRVRGSLTEVRERSVAGMPALEAVLDDGTASLAVVWLGRRAIAGIEPGRAMTASGRVSMTHGRPVLFNPRYELQPRGQE